MLSDNRHRVLRSKAQSLITLASIYESAAQEKLDLFLKGKCAFTKDELYGFITQGNRGTVKIEIPYTDHLEFASSPGFKMLYFWTTDDFGRRFLGEEYIKHNEGSILQFAGGKRKGHSFVFVKSDDFPDARQACANNIVNLISQANQCLDQCDACLKECDSLILDLTVSQFIDRLTKEVVNEAKRNY